MYRSGTIVYFFLVLLAITSFTTAIDLDGLLFQKRQNAPIGTGASASTAAPSTQSPTTAAAPSTPSTTPQNTTPNSTPAPTTAASPTQESTTPQPSSTPSLASTASASAPAPAPAPSSSSLPPPDTSSSAASSPTSSSPPPSSDQQKTTASVIRTTLSPVVVSRTQQIVTTVLTVSGGSTIAQVLTTNTIVPSTSIPIATSTAAAGLDSSGNSAGSSGLSDSNKNTIIGVCVGIGGAIILGGLAVVAYRVWGRKKAQHDDDDDLMGTQLGSGAHEKTGSANDNSPFKSTLDQYHTPAGKVNPSANF